MFSLEGFLLPGVAFGRERFVVWRYAESPIGPYSGIGRIDLQGRMTVYTAVPASADLQRVWHRIHDVKRGETRVEVGGGRLRAVARPDDAAEIEVDCAVGFTLPSAALSLSLALKPRFVREHALFLAAAGPVARVLLGVGAGRRFAGRTETGVGLRVAARTIRAVREGRALVGGQDCGPLRAVDDPPDWGEVVMPRRPYLLGCRLLVDAAVPDLSRAAPATEYAR